MRFFTVLAAAVPVPAYWSVCFSSCLTGTSCRLPLTGGWNAPTWHIYVHTHWGRVASSRTASPRDDTPELWQNTSPVSIILSLPIKCTSLWRRLQLTLAPQPQREVNAVTFQRWHAVKGPAKIAELDCVWEKTSRFYRRHTWWQHSRRGWVWCNTLERPCSRKSGVRNGEQHSGIWPGPRGSFFPHLLKITTFFARALAHRCRRKEQRLERQSLWSLQSPLLNYRDLQGSSWL